MENLKELEQRLVAATGADREIDRDLWKAFAPADGWMKHIPNTLHWHDGHPWAPFTASLDAAHALCERLKLKWHVSYDGYAEVFDLDADGEDKFERAAVLHTASDGSPALALCLAIVRALLAGKGEG